VRALKAFLERKKNTGRPTKFKADNFLKLYHMIVVGKAPLQYKFAFALWAREMECPNFLFCRHIHPISIPLNWYGAISSTISLRK